MTTSGWGKGSFLRDDEQRWVSSSLFFHCISRLSVQEDVYYLPTGSVVSPTELRFYVAALEAHLKFYAVINSEEDQEALAYVQNVCRILKKWAEDGYATRLV